MTYELEFLARSYGENGLGAKVGGMDGWGDVCRWPPFWPIDFFWSSRGLRQGKCLSLYLFVLAIETFSRHLIKAREGGFISGFSMGRVGQGGVEISHILYVDDSINCSLFYFFCEAKVEQLKYLNWTLWGSFWVKSQYGEEWIDSIWKGRKLKWVCCWIGM